MDDGARSLAGSIAAYTCEFVDALCESNKFVRLLFGSQKRRSEPSVERVFAQTVLKWLLKFYSLRS